MNKRVFIIHGWEGNPEEPLHKWMKNQLSEKGFEVTVPLMPDPSEPKIKPWVSHLRKVTESLDENTYFICHSIGCQTLMRLLQEQEAKIGGAVFLAGWFDLTNLENEEVEKEAELWLITPINIKKVKKLIGKLTVLLSDNDPFVRVDTNSKIFREKLGAKIIIEKNMGHFSEDYGIKKCPDAIKELLEMAK